MSFLCSKFKSEWHSSYKLTRMPPLRRLLFLFRQRHATCIGKYIRVQWMVFFSCKLFAGRWWHEWEWEVSGYRISLEALWRHSQCARGSSKKNECRYFYYLAKNSACHRIYLIQGGSSSLSDDPTSSFARKDFHEKVGTGLKHPDKHLFKV